MPPKASKSSAQQRSRSASAKPVQKAGGTYGPAGKLTREETTNLLLQAREAFDHQSKLGRVEPGTEFNEWRRDMVMDRVAKPGISKINRSEWKAVKALFLELSGREDEAFTLLNKTGTKSYRPTSPTDTWETCETYVALIREALANHASIPAASLPHPKGHIGTGWFLAAARQRTGKPTLILDTLAERLDPETLCGLLAHLKSHIATREGRASDRRAPRSYPKKADPGDFTPGEF